MLSSFFQGTSPITGLGDIAPRLHAIEKVINFSGKEIARLPWSASLVSSSTNPRLVVLRQDCPELEVNPEAMTCGGHQRVTHIHIVPPTSTIQHQVNRLTRATIGKVIGTDAGHLGGAPHPGPRAARTSIPALCQKRPRLSSSEASC